MIFTGLTPIALISQIARIRPTAMSRDRSRWMPDSTFHVAPENHCAWMSPPVVIPKIASTEDQPAQYPIADIGPARLNRDRQPSKAYIAMPPECSGNMVAGSVLILFLSTATT